MTFGSGKRCNAFSKRTGKQCKNPVIAGSEFCFLHTKRQSRKRGAPRGNKSNLRHGANSETLKEYKRRIAGGVDIQPGFLAFDILNMEERKAFLVMVDGMCGDFNPAAPSDFHEIELLATCMILLHRAINRGSMKAVSALERMVRLGMRDLKLGKTAAERALGMGKKQRKITPAEWAAAILKSVEEEEAREQADQPEDKIKENEEYRE
ncbi:MAG: hypothetical protein AB1546_11330 [bacterium]